MGEQHYNEPSSFRDRSSQVFYSNDRVLRGLNSHATIEWKRLSATSFFSKCINEGKLISTNELQKEDSPPCHWTTVLQHRRIPFVSYPYEWSFGMLKDAALLHLELMELALSEGMILKDASSFNIQWLGCSPTHIDIPSFIELKVGEPWIGYRQYCQMFLYPLMLLAYRNVQYHGWLRGYPEGIPVEEFSALLSLRDRFRRGVLSHVYLQAALQRRFSMKRTNVRNELKASGFNQDLIRTNVRGLMKLVSGLKWRQVHSNWSQYEATCPSYNDEDFAAKRDFVTRMIARKKWGLVWDLGCNTGKFSEIAAAQSLYVVAVDADSLTIERLYQRLKADGNKKILPLVLDLSNPSPGLGWRGTERSTIEKRGNPELVICLALIHHLVFSHNIPLYEVIAWLRSFGAVLIIEFVSKQDPMVQILLNNKEDQYSEYSIEAFERYLTQSFTCEHKQTLVGGNRTIYFVTPI